MAIPIIAIMDQQTACKIVGPMEVEEEEVEEEEEVALRGHATDARRKGTGAQIALSYKEAEVEVQGEVEGGVTVVMVINSLQAEGVVRQQDPASNVERQVTGVRNVRKLGVAVVRDTKDFLYCDVSCAPQDRAEQNSYSFDEYP